MTEHAREYTESILRDIEENEDGIFQLENRAGRAFLSVSKPGKKGKAVLLTDVVSRLGVFGIEQYDKSRIEKIVKTSDGKFYEIGIWSGGIPENSNLQIEVPHDNMEVFALLTPPKHGGTIIHEMEIREELKNAGISHGILEDGIQKLSAGQNYFKKYKVAAGKPPVPGKKGYIRLHFESLHKPSLKEDEHGRVDYKEIGIIQSVGKGDLIAEKIDPEPGELGETVFGEKIPFEAAGEAEWKIGPNCELSPDRKQLFSTITGRPIRARDGMIHVDEVCYLKNVDFSTGNVDFPGTIIVEETVADGFKLTTKGSIIIKKSVGKVFLSATGDIILSGGVMGRNGGVIQSGSNIYAKFVEQGKIIASGSISIGEASMHSELFAGDAIMIQGGRGELIGGEAVAGNYISVVKLGAVVETRTTVTVGIPPTIIMELEKIKTDLASKMETLKKIKMSISKLMEKASKKELSDEEKEMLTKLHEVEKKYSTLVSQAEMQFESIVTTFEPSAEAYVEVEKNIFPNVTVNLGKGKVFKSELKSYNGRNIICMFADGVVGLSNSIPKKSKKKTDSPIEQTPAY